MAAGHLTRAADRPIPDQPSVLARQGSFPDNRVSFRLQTPRDKGIGVQLGIFKQPETQSYKVAAAERSGHFGRQRCYFSHYCHMQQKSKMLIPTLPTQSRTHDMQRVWSDVAKHELERTQAMSSMAHRDESRKARLRQAKALLQTKSLAKDVTEKLQVSCSFPDRTEELCGEQAPILELLNRRVDVNRLKRCRQQAAEQQRAQVLKQSVVETPELKDLLDDINRFENENLPDLHLETMVDWHDCEQQLEF